MDRICRRYPGAYNGPFDRRLGGVKFAQEELPWWAQAAVERLIIEERLWEIPLSETAFSDAVASTVESENVTDLYRLLENYMEHLKAQSRKRH